MCSSDLGKKIKYKKIHDSDDVHNMSATWGIRYILKLFLLLLIQFNTCQDCSTYRVELITTGAGVPGCMHGGGSPDGAKMMINASSDINHYIELAKRLTDIKEEIKVEPRKR